MTIIIISPVNVGIIFAAELNVNLYLSSCIKLMCSCSWTHACIVLLFSGNVHVVI